jgi:outer membrane protein assembly factor BamB
MIWRFLAARNDRMICVQSQLESAWPVFGSVMIDDGGIIVTAGRQSAIDGGISVYNLDPADGSVRWQTKLWSDPDADIEPELIRSRIRNQRVNDLLVHNGRQPCLWITPLKKSYAAGERVDIETDVFAARAMKYSIPSKDELRELEGATWLWSASSAGWLSRRNEGVGRFDGKGVNYAQLNASKICLTTDGDLFALDGHVGKSQNFRGGLSRVRWHEDGRLPDAPDWSVKAPPGAPDAMIVAGDRIYVATSRWKGDATLSAFSTLDGELRKEIKLPARVARDGLAAANGHLYLSGVDGTVWCMGE